MAKYLDIELSQASLDKHQSDPAEYLQCFICTHQGP